ncbi:MAG: C10 family peptidase [Deltaproteobacteria bacterium]|nr:C10 family peptidase [Deltaproteobacteria bacterium]
MHKIKKNFTVIGFLLILFTPVFWGVSVFGADDEYDIVARNFLKYLNSDKEIVSTRIIEGNHPDSLPAKVSVAFLANLKNGGYILVSTSRNLTPIKAYSLSDDFLTLPEAYKKFLLSEMEYNARTIMARKRTTQVATVSQAQKSWDFLLNFEQVRATLAYTPDTYLLTTQWDQNDPYNKFLPESNGETVVAGCVNIAMAQVMKYHNYPAKGTGVASFSWDDQELKAIFYRTCNWENMPNVLDSTQPEPEYKVDEVALLIRDLAIMNHTDFGLDGSTASPNTDAWIENFGYSNSITSITNDDVTLFFNILRSEIDAERPVLLCFPGHMTVADGYSSNETGREIHVNMGWGGHYDDYYFLDNDVEAGDYTYSPDLTIYYNIAPCSGANCFENLESDDKIDDLNITGEFDDERDVDRYELYLKGNTTITGTRTGYGNQAFFISIYDFSCAMIVSSHQAISQNLSAGRYTVRISLCSETGTYYSYDADKIDYSVLISTNALTNAEKTEIDDSLDVLPVINSRPRDILLDSSDQEPYKILIDARDQNGDVLNIGVNNSNNDAVQAALSGNILSLAPVSGASHVASRITVAATANNRTAEKSFVVMILDEDISFGKKFIVSGIFENQDDFNTHKIIPDGTCTISGYNGYSNQGFFSSLMDKYENEIVPPVDNVINRKFARDVYFLGAALKKNPGGSGRYYNYIQGENDQYQLTVCCPDANDSVESIATILGIDLSGTVVPGDVDNNETVELSDAILSFQVSAGICPVSTVHHGADVNGDNKIGIAESIYILQKVSGIMEKGCGEDLF